MVAALYPEHGTGLSDQCLLRGVEVELERVVSTCSRSLVVLRLSPLEHLHRHR